MQKYGRQPISPEVEVASRMVEMAKLLLKHIAGTERIQLNGRHLLFEKNISVERNVTSSLELAEKNRPLKMGKDVLPGF